MSFKSLRKKKNIKIMKSVENIILHKCLSRGMGVLLFSLSFLIIASCRDRNILSSDDILIESVQVNGMYVDDKSTLDSVDHKNVELQIAFNAPVDTTRFNKQRVYFSQPNDTEYNFRFDSAGNTLIIKPVNVESLSSYRFKVETGRNMGGIIRESFTFDLVTQLDTVPKFGFISDDSLLTLVQKQTLGYFIGHAHESSGFARDRLGSGDIVTSGGTGFGIMALLTGIQRNFISREDGLAHLRKIITFLSSSDRFHGAFSHWYNGSTGRTLAFSPKDNGADLVQTAFLMQGLLTARQYFNDGSPEEKALCDTITRLWEDVEWDWFISSGQNVLFRYWSPDYSWDMNTPVAGWNEALIVYVLAASSPTHPVSRDVYDKGWARNGDYPMKNGKSFYKIRLPLGEDYGGPLRYSHYSFLGLDPRNLSDSYADYWEQNVAHSRINYNYCVENPKNAEFYSSECWGLTTSIIPDGDAASSPVNDLGVIAPTAAISSFPYTPEESMRALKYFYYVLGDRLWGEYGFYDAFDAEKLWFADSYIAVNQGSIVCMIENYRSGLLWDLFMSSEEIQKGLDSLGFQYKKV